MILDEIMAHKRDELAYRERVVPLAELKARAADAALPADFAAALSEDGLQLIAEVKRASPSRGVLRPDLDPVDTAATYAANGAAAISVLTDTRFFHGELDFLSRIKSRLPDVVPNGSRVGDSVDEVPIMRKDFLFDPYHVYESRASGADALLLIAAILPADTLDELLGLTHELGMSALVEIHNESEAERAIEINAQIVGINNRDLRDFSVDLNTFGRLHSLLPEDVIAVAESGVHDVADVHQLKTMGADAVLVGEALVTAPDVGKKVRELVDGGRVKPKDANQEVAP